MESQAEEEKQPAGNYVDLINTFCEITSSSREEASFFLESHKFDLDSAVSTFLESSNFEDVAATAFVTAAPGVAPSSHPPPNPRLNSSPSYSPSDSPSRSRSPSPTPPRRAPINGYSLRSRQSTKPSGTRTGRIRTFSDLNRRSPSSVDSDSDSDVPQEYYTGGQKSGMLVQDPPKFNDVEEIFSQALQAGARAKTASDHQPSSSSSRSFTGTGRLLSGETVPGAPQQPAAITHTIVFWSNGFTVNDGPFRRLDDPANADFLQSIKNSECPNELEPADRSIPVHVNLMRKGQDYTSPDVPSQASFQGQGRTLGGAAEPSSVPNDDAAAATAAPSLIVAPTTSIGLVLDDALPTTSIQLRLADGTRMIARFNYSHTIRDIRSFIDASRSGGSRNYQLQTVGFPPKQLTNLDQTIEEAGIANSVVLQKP